MFLVGVSLFSHAFLVSLCTCKWLRLTLFSKKNLKITCWHIFYGFRLFFPTQNKEKSNGAKANKVFQLVSTKLFNFYFLKLEIYSILRKTNLEKCKFLTVLINKQNENCIKISFSSQMRKNTEFLLEVWQHSI